MVILPELYREPYSIVLKAICWYIEINVVGSGGWPEKTEEAAMGSRRPRWTPPKSTDYCRTLSVQAICQSFHNLA